ncbi:acyl-carrier-protein S-malonyltransferase [Bacillus sp. TS-2]|nr:acyl-carrier-protein S-malonyltransferase [Bacillus sp. TS-2]
MGKVAFLFPGQGSQAVGMGNALREDNESSQQFFERADKRLGYELSKIIEEGPEETLRRTEHTQPALVTMSIAVLELLKEEGITPDYVAGHSLGEYSALVAAGALSFEDAVYAVRNRGLFMEEAVPFGEGAMAAVLGLDRTELQAICEEVSKSGYVVELANINCPGQIVISGTAEGVEIAGGQAKEKGAKRVLPLQVSGPFHSSLMKPASRKLEKVLDEIELVNANVPVIANVTATSVTEAEQLKNYLIEQVYSPVLWEDSISYLLSEGVDTFIEIGSGTVLAGLVKKINRRSTVFSIQDRASLNKMLDKVKEEEN